MSIDTLPQQAEQTTSWLLKRLHEHQTPMSLQELEARFADQQGLSHRTLKETAWKLVEEGKIQFTSSWDLEIC
ncbi:conserved hypothetical protein [Hyella patelloides LEGE 07179]|uniref:Uncharacterized protein n=1 Tax=Hyella patelloides LEGE 07179 TaxID=945734 RepID=A0A563VVI2_9CYAN|nr:hypothetical protein [Hyella patelloides]VEP15478.1 conserved hypothetical protein [Hyella patelloides LEGE 07179]